MFFFGLTLLGFLLLIFFTLRRDNHYLWFDEKWYLENVFLLQKMGLKNDFLLKYKGPAGPTFAVLHYLLSPLTGLALPNLRIVNISLSVLIVYVLYLILKRLKHNYAAIISLSFFAIPTIYVCTGMALTEIPAMFFLVTSIFFLVESLHQKSQVRTYILVICSGLLISLAILGRQPYLVVVLASPILFFRNKTINTSLIITYLITALAIPIYIFYLWKNIQPPSEAYTGSGFKIFHGLLAFGYAYILFILIAPSWISVTHLKSKCLILIGVCSINYFLIKIQFLPIMSLSKAYLSSNLQEAFSLIFASCIIFLGILFLINCFNYLKQKQYNSLDLFFVLSMILILSTSAKVTHQFSSRYVVQAVPFIVLISRDNQKLNLLKLLLTASGIILGLLTLNSYFN